MGVLISFADARAERVKAKLCALAAGCSPAMVETADSLIDARRIFCRDSVAVLIDRYGYQTRVGYTEINDVSPVLPVDDILRLAEGQLMSQDEEPEQETAKVLRFPHRKIDVG